MNCPVCQGGVGRFIAGTTSAREYFARADSYEIAAGEKDKLPVWRCGKCGHGFTPIDFDPALIEKWYERAEVDDQFLKGEAGRRKTASKVLERLEGFLPDKGRLLDVGAGPGFFVSEAQRRGWQASGLEAAGWAVKFGREKLGLTSLRRGGLSGRFKVVTAFDVIEHVADPREFLSKCAQRLEPGGWLVLTTPKFDSWLAKAMGRNWYCIFPAHLHYFTTDSLRRSLAGAGFEIKEIRQHTRYLGWKYVLARGLKQLGFRGEETAKTSAVIPVSFGDEFEVYARLK